jgi:endonuclease YncB( thermonuclease family)
MIRLTVALVALLVAAITLALAAAMINYVGNLPVSNLAAIDGDTIAMQGEAKHVRIVGLDAPETGNRARCPEERALAEKAKARLQELVSTGSVWLRTVPCSCPPEMLGTKACNDGRLCAKITADDQDVAALMIAEGLARPFVCGETSCPKTESWCQ